MIPRKPNGSQIEEHVTPDACTLKWGMPSSGVKGYLPVISSVCVMGYLIYQFFWLFPRLWPTLILPLLFVAVSVVRLVRLSRPESITLGSDSFRHDLGQAGGHWAHVDAFRNHGFDSRPQWKRLLGVTPVVEIPKDELGEIVIERVGGQLLPLHVAPTASKSGADLREPEKEWLAEVLKEWQGGEKGEKKASGTFYSPAAPLRLVHGATPRKKPSAVQSRNHSPRSAAKRSSSSAVTSAARRIASPTDSPRSRASSRTCCGRVSSWRRMT